MGIEDLRLVKVSDKIYYMECLEEFDWCTIGLVVGENHTAMIDSGASGRHVALFLKKLEENNLPKPDICVLSHWHWDHTYGLAHLDGVVSFANHDTNKLIGKMQGWGWSDAEMRARIESGEDLEFSYPNLNAEYPDKSLIKIKKADVEFRDSITLDLGGITIQAKQIENSHSYDSTVFYVPEEKTIFLGDIVYHDLLPVTPVYYKGLHEKLLSGLRKFDFDKAITGHQPMMSEEELYSMLTQAEPVIDY